MLLNLFKSERARLPLRLAGERIFMRPPERADWEDWVDVRSRNEKFLKPWSPTGALADITREGYNRRLAGYVEEWDSDRGYTFFIFRNDTNALVGGVTLNNIVRGAGQMANLGYWLDEEETRQGFMTEAVLLACQFGFCALKLHRIQAGTLPENVASQKVLLNCGFHAEGISRRYIRINGEWRDHQMFSLLSEEFISLGGSHF
ncbi:MAG TPA: GNAT family protein [Patescibacteria group bacterium]|nr:GNAT family protein [Patescibacteria group bacterium]